MMLEKGYRWLSILRISSVTAILGTAAYYYRFLGTEFVARIAFFIFSIYILTFALGYYIRASKPRTVFAYLLFALDISIYTAIIFMTGALNSSFLFLYGIAIIAAAVVLSSKGAFFAAFYSSLMLGFMVFLIYKDILPPGDWLENANPEGLPALAAKAFLQSLFLFFIAALSSYFAEAVKSKTIELGRLKESLTRARMDTSFILQNIPSAVLVLDRTGNVLYINDAAKRVLQDKNSKSVLKNIEQVRTLWPQLYSIFQNQSAEGNSRNKDSYEKELSFNGRNYLVIFSNLPNAQRFIFTIQDVTEQKKLQERLREQEKYALLGQQMAEMVHSLGNPVAALKGVVQMLKKGASPKDTEKLMDILDEEITKISSILHQYRQFSHNMDLVCKEHNVKDFFDSLIRKLRYMIGELQDINLRLVFHNPPEIACFDDERLEEAVVNLVRNSADALAVKGGDITIGVVGQGDRVSGWHKSWTVPGGYWGVYVKDNGPGINKGIINKIFTPSFTTKAQGLGLGLAMTRRIAKIHGGSVDFDTQEGEGTIFLLLLPRRNKKNSEV